MVEKSHENEGFCKDAGKSKSSFCGSMPLSTSWVLWKAKNNFILKSVTINLVKGTGTMKDLYPLAWTIVSTSNGHNF